MVLVWPEWETICWNALLYRVGQDILREASRPFFHPFVQNKDFLDTGQHFLIKTAQHFIDETSIESSKLKIKNWISKLTIYRLVPLITFFTKNQEFFKWIEYILQGNFRLENFWKWLLEKISQCRYFQIHLWTVLNYQNTWNFLFHICWKT